MRRVHKTFSYLFGVYILLIHPLAGLSLRASQARFIAQAETQINHLYLLIISQLKVNDILISGANIYLFRPNKNK